MLRIHHIVGSAIGLPRDDCDARYSGFGKGIEQFGAIGVDAIPSEIKNSVVLTGNDLGMLGNVDAFPLEADVDKFAKEHDQYVGIDLLKKHTFAKAFLEKNDVIRAWKALLMK